MILIDGKLIAESIIEKLKPRCNIVNHVGELAILQVGHNAASNIYVANKLKIATKIGLRAQLYNFPTDVTEQELCVTVQKLNQRGCAIIVQLPLPKHITSNNVIETILPELDADGLTRTNQSFLFTQDPKIIPCTPRGILELLKYYNFSLKGKHVVIIGRSNLVGRPLIPLMLMHNCTVTSCNSYTENLKEISSAADILISAIGKPKFITKDFVKQNAIVIDVGISKIEDDTHGDIDFQAVKSKTFAITPVPGGVGPMTVAMLMLNTIEIFERKLAKVISS